MGTICGEACLSLCRNGRTECADRQMEGIRVEELGAVTEMQRAIVRTDSHDVLVLSSSLLELST